MSKQATELEFLKYFYRQAGHAFGPADDDIYRGIAEDFEASTGKQAPDGYRRDEE